VAKHDHAAIQQTFVAVTPDDERSRFHTRDWLAVEGNVERLLEAVASGQSVRRYCERAQLTYAVVQRALTSDAWRELYHTAQEELAEHLMGECERVCEDIESGETDPKAGAVILANLQWRISKLNQRRYSDRQVIEQHVIDHAKMHRQAIANLARAPRQAIEGQVVRPALPAPERGTAPLSVGQAQAERVPLDDGGDAG
jgi:hypothetical protein